MRRACKRAGLRLVQWHCMRHSFASHLVMRGVPLKAVQELHGHASMEMTMRYAHLSPDVRRDAVNTLVNVHPDGNMAATCAVKFEEVTDDLKCHPRSGRAERRRGPRTSSSIGATGCKSRAA